MAFLTPVWLGQGGTPTYEGGEDRALIAALLGARWPTLVAKSSSPITSGGGGHGVLSSSDFIVTAGAGLSVDRTAGYAFVRGTQQGDQGVYGCGDASPENLAIGAADATNPRKDLVVLRVRDSVLGIAGDDVGTIIVPGTPTAGLVAGDATGRPTVPENSLLLYEVYVPAGAVSSASFTISDLRTYAAALGGIRPCTSTTRPSSPYEGMVIVELDTDREMIYSGTAWVRMGAYSTSGRTGVALRRSANQSVPNNSGTLVTWDAEDQDTDGFIAVPSSTVTIPAGQGGLYVCTVGLSWASTGTYAVGAAITAGGVTFSSIGTNQFGSSAITEIFGLTAGQTVAAQAYQNSGGALNVTGSLALYRLGG